MEMAMIAVNMYEAKTKLSALVASIEEHGGMVTICRNGRAVAQLGPVQKGRDPLKQSGRLKRVVFKADPSSPLSAEEWPEHLR
jgi:antitoxin (DNA-binding transcriptional repressor) of toxin-antitoxin stability system